MARCAKCIDGSELRAFFQAARPLASSVGDDGQRSSFRVSEVRSALQRVEAAAAGSRVHKQECTKGVSALV